MTASISRRNLLKGAAFSAAGVAALGMAGCAPQAEGSKGSDDLAETGEGAGKHTWEVKPEPIAADQISQTVDTEVLIIGGGYSGTCCALSAAENGAKVVLVEKDAVLNGHGVGGTGAIASRALDELGLKFDKSLEMERWVSTCGNRCRESLVGKWFRESERCMNWFLDMAEANGAQCMVTVGSNSTVHPEIACYHFMSGGPIFEEHTMADFVEYMFEAEALKAGAEFVYEMPAVQLVQDESGHVTGVIGEGPDGYVKVNAAKGVILCTGDTSDDEEMLAAYCPIMLGVQSMHGAPCNTGDGHKMALWAGASMDPAPHTMMMHFDPTWMPEGNAPYSGIPWLRVNLNGERFGNENLGYQSHVTQVRFQPEMTAFQIIDKNWDKHAPKGDYKHPNSHSRSTADPANDWADALKRGAIIEANTLEELADKCGINKENFLATVKRYNELVDAGKDEDFGVDSTFMTYNGIKEAPFYALKRMPALLCTAGGLTINEKLEVLNEAGEPLGGLYAAGNASGSYYGDDYPLFITGGSHGRAWTFGVLAARSALGLMDESVETLGA